jgi:hypothetical protein
MLSNMKQQDRGFESPGGFSIGLAALGATLALLAPLGAGAQQTQQQQTQQQQQAQHAVVPANQRPVTPQIPLRTGSVPANGTNNNVQGTQNNALLNLLHGGNNANANTNANANNATQQRPVQNNLTNLLQGRTGTQNAGTQNNGTQNNALQNLLQKGGNQNTGTQNPGTQKASLPLNGTQANNMRSLPNASHLSPAIANQPTGRAVPSRTFVGHPGPAGSVETTNRNGDIVRKAADGSVIDVHSPKNGMLIHHALNGNRRVVVDRPDHSRIVTASRGVQYVQHPYNFGGHTYVNRTFYVHGQVAHQLYRPYNAGGTSYDVYATGRYYEPKFYQWATSRQATPQPFTWAYTNTNPPWYNYYKGYFTPESSYSTPLLWLTDFMFTSSLASHYQNNSPPPSDAPTADGAAPITPEVKQAVADEVARQVKLEATEAQQNAQHRDPDPAPASAVNLVSDGQQHTLIADSDLDLVDPSGRRCMISEGDTIQTIGAPQPGSGTVSAIVMSSKGGMECGRATQVEVALTDMQEMLNHFRETMDQGMANTNAAKAVNSQVPEFAASAPPADADAPHELEQEQQLAALADG